MPRGIEFPSHLFATLAQHLGITKGAILLPSHADGSYTAWASIGLDQTSVHRLSIPEHEIKELYNDQPAGVTLREDASRILAPYLSRREAAMLETVVLFPIANDTTIGGVLVVAASPYLAEHEEYLRTILAAVGTPAASLVRKYRLERSDVMHRAIIFHRDELSTLAGRLAEKAGDSITVATLELTDAVAQIAASNDYLDTYRVWQDMLNVIATMLSGTGTVCDLESHRLVAFLHAEQELDLQLFVHQIAATLVRLFPELPAQPVIRYETAVYPDDGDDLAELAARLL